MGSASITLYTANETLGHSTIQWNAVNIYGHQGDMDKTGLSEKMSGTHVLSI